ncbi:protein kinase, partial [bacterium]|nr:protein kinase [bacterium]
GRTKLTKTGTTVGTVAYMSPEQAHGEEIDHRTDIWSLGVLLYEMICGQLPFKGDYEQAMMYSITNEEPEPLTGLRTGLPVELERIASKAIKKKADERYQNIGDMLLDLKGLKKELESDVKIQPAEIVESAERKNWFKLVSMSVGVALILALAFFMLKSFISEEVLGSAPEPIAVLPFENLTGNSSFDIYQKSIANLLIAKLEQSKYLRVTTWERMGDLLKQTGNNNIKIVDIDKETSFELCRMDGVDAAVTGSFFKMGDRFTIEVKVLDVASKNILVSETSDGEGENSIFKQIDRLARVISRGMGLSERKIVDAEKSIEEVTTASMDAYNYFLRGRDEYEKGYKDDARRFLKKAVELDSTFAVAHLYLARVYANLRYVQQEEGAYERAKTFSEKATDK